MKSLLVRIMGTLCLLAFATSAVQAQIEPDAATVSYFNSKPFGEMTVMYGIYLDKQFLQKERCEGSYGFEPLTFSIIQPLKFSSGQDHPTAGQWSYRFRFKRCGSEQTYNAVWLAVPGRLPAPSALPPGMSRADLSLAGTLKNVTASAGLREHGVPQDCKAIRVLDTRVTMEPTTLSLSGKVFEKVWEEEWTAHMCGIEFKTSVCLVPKPSGGTDWLARNCPR